MNAILDFPVIAETPPATVPATIKATVLAQFTATESSLRTLAAKYRDVAYDCTTPKGLAAAKEARLDLRENGRYLVERAEKRIKAEVNDLKKTMADEVDRLVSIVRPAEDAIHAQIVAREEQIAAERAEAERQAAEAARIEAERKQRHEDGIATLEGYVAKARGKPAYQIANGIAFVEKIVIDPAHWQEYTERANNALNETLLTLRDMYGEALKAEQDAAELAALRAEKAELAERERQERERAAAAEAEAQLAEDTERLGSQQVLKAEPAGADATDRETPANTSPRGGAMGAGQATAVAPVGDTYLPASTVTQPLEPAPEIPTVSLGIIGTRLGFKLSEAFIAGTLHMPPAGKQGMAVLWRESDWPAIKTALIAHIESLA